MVFFRPIGGGSTTWQPVNQNQPNNNSGWQSDFQPFEQERNPALGENRQAHALFAPQTTNAAQLMQSPEEALLQMADGVYQRILMKINQANNPFLPPEQRMQMLAEALGDCEDFIDTLKDSAGGSSPNFAKMLIMRFKELHRSIAESINEGQLETSRPRR